MTEPTNADRERAEQVIRALSPEQAFVDEFVYDGDVEPLIAAVAAALAEERGRARAQFLAIAERFAAHFGGEYVDPDEVHDWLGKQVNP